MTWGWTQHSRPKLGWPLQPAGLAIWYPWLLFSWWQVAEEKIRSVTPPGAASLAIPVMVAIALATHIAGRLGEALFYRLWWRWRGLDLPCWRFFSWIAVYSAADLFALSLAQRAEEAPALAAWIAPVAGLGLLPSLPLHDDPALRAGFGSLGLLTAARIAITAHAQAVALGIRFRRPLTLTLGAWLVLRLISWWSVDLLRGASPLP